MEVLIPPLLAAARELRWQIGAGRSMREAFRRYLESAQDEVAADLRERWTLATSGGTMTSKPMRSPYRRALWDLVQRGSAGQPVLEPLAALEEEIEAAAQAELDLHLATLPFKVMLPLLLLQFPAHLILLLGPMLREFRRALDG